MNLYIARTMAGTVVLAEGKKAEEGGYITVPWGTTFISCRVQAALTVEDEATREFILELSDECCIPFKEIMEISENEEPEMPGFEGTKEALQALTIRRQS